MKFSSYTGVYALTLLVSAALLFSIQPMFSKMILPLLGGTPQVWTTAMVFFQLTLLAGYAYAHGTTRIMSVKTQSIFHLILLCAFAALLPFMIADGTRPPVDQDPTLWQLTLMAMVIGGPFFILSGSAPMFQRWFSETDHPDSDNPYFLYGASNLGSMTSLLAYPVLIEPFFTLDAQAEFWMYGYYLLITMSVICAVIIWTHKQKSSAETAPAETTEAITWKRRGYWLLVAFLPSSLMLGVTTFITTDIASAPLLWILPLAIYVGTFILVFARKQWLSKTAILNGFAAAMAVMLTVSIAYNAVHPIVFILVHLTVFFFAAMLCHKELADARPRASHLTEFYLLMSLGGALGGIFNAIIAPRFFILPLEYGAILLFIVFLRYASIPGQDFKTRFAAFKTNMLQKGFDALFELPTMGLIGIVLIVFFITFIPGKATTIFGALVMLGLFFMMAKTRWSFALACLFAMAMFPPGYFWHTGLGFDVIHRDRNFFGVIRITDFETGERAFIHGTTNHGTQPLDEEWRMTTLSYYSQFSPINDLYEYLDEKNGDQKIAVIGLGVGVTACFTKDDRAYDFFEIDPDVARIAENTEYFTYLADCGSPYEIILGDGRLTMMEQDDNMYDVIFLDAYSSDNIPIHLITVEALQMYMQKLKENGTLILNISNNFLDIEPVLHEAAKEMGIPAFGKVTNGGQIEGTDLVGYPAQFVFISKDPDLIAYMKELEWTETMPRQGVRLWTDKYSNILSVLSNITGMKRYEAIKEEEGENEEEIDNAQQ